MQLPLKEEFNFRDWHVIKNGQSVIGILIPIYGNIRSVCAECNRSITKTKSNEWVHSDGSFMMHKEFPKQLQ